MTTTSSSDPNKAKKVIYHFAKKRKELPPGFYEDLIETENDFYINPSTEIVQKLVLLYKMASEYYSGRDAKIANSFSQEVTNILMNPISVNLLKRSNNSAEKHDSAESSNKKFLTKKAKSKYAIQINIDGVDSHFEEYKNEADLLIEKANANCDNFEALLKKSDDSQKKNLYKKVQKLAFKTQVSEEVGLERRGSISSVSSVSSIAAKRRKSSLKLKLEGNLSGKEDRKGSIFEKKESSMRLKKDSSDEIKAFLKGYHKRLCFLLQSNIGDAILQLNKILDEAHKKKVERFHEYQGNLKDYILMGDSFKDLIEELKNDYLNDLKEIDKTQEESLNNLCKQLLDSKIKDNIAIGNLNMETMGEIVNLFK